MNTITSIGPHVGKSEFQEIVIWAIIVLLIATGFQKIKEVIASLLMKLYEFFIQNNAIKL